MAQVGRPVLPEQGKCLVVGQMSPAAADAPFQVKRVGARLQHHFVIVRLQESGMALPEIVDQLIANHADIGKYSYGHFMVLHNETAGFCRIMFFTEGSDLQAADADGPACAERGEQCTVQPQPAVPECLAADIHRQSVFLRQYFQAFDVVCMFMRNKDGLHLVQRKLQMVHAPLCFPAGQACIDQYSGVFTAHIIAISVTPRIQRRDQQ